MTTSRTGTTWKTTSSSMTTRHSRAPRRRSPSSDASPPKSTAFVMLGVTVLVAAAVFLARRLRIRRRASRDAPRVPTLAVDGAAPRKACEHCGATAPKSPGAAKLLRCGRCKSAFFCSVECQRVAWKTHKSVCRPVESDASAPRTDVSAPRTTAAAVAAHRPSQNDSGAATARKSAARDEMRRKSPPARRCRRRPSSNGDSATRRVPSGPGVTANPSSRSKTSPPRRTTSAPSRAVSSVRRFAWRVTV